MRVALLHYWLTNVRGGEKVLAALGEMFPGADVFTHAYVPGNMEGMFAGRKVTESFIARLPLGRRHPQAYLPLLPAATRSLKLDGYDLIVSSESGPIKGIRRPKGARHVCYCHTPMRYLWDMHDEYYRTAGLGGKIAMRLFTGYLRKEDLRSAEAVESLCRAIEEFESRSWSADACRANALPFSKGRFRDEMQKTIGGFLL